jgi:lincosamide nucleotidyltransferase A/C/D/E
MFTADLVLAVLDRVPDAVVDGGWGIDALAGRVTRAHGDLDLVVPLARAEAIASDLAPLGFAVEADERPTRLVLARDPTRIDLHLVAPFAAGPAQTLPDGTRFTYVLDRHPGSIAGRAVPCLSPPMQVLTHTSYEPDDADRADMRVLRSVTHEALPPPYVMPTGDEPIRDAVVSDAAALCTVRHRAWKHAYEGVLPRAALDAMDLGAAFKSWWPFLRLRPTPRHGALVAGVPGAVVGFAVMSPCRDRDLDPDASGEIDLLYVDPTALGLGLGHRLFEAAIAWLRGRGFTDLRLWTLQGNSGARSFYERHGWWHDGAVRTETEGDASWLSVRYRAARP